jgi:hypothetical protein
MDRKDKFTRELLIELLESDKDLWGDFKGWLELRELDIEFILYEDSLKYPEETFKMFRKFKRDKKILREVYKDCFNKDGSLKAIRKEPLPTPKRLKIPLKFKMSNKKGD